MFHSQRLSCSLSVGYMCFRSGGQEEVLEMATRGVILMKDDISLFSDKDNLRIWDEFLHQCGCTDSSMSADSSSGLSGLALMFCLMRFGCCGKTFCTSCVSLKRIYPGRET